MPTLVAAFALLSSFSATGQSAAALCEAGDSVSGQPVVFTNNSNTNFGVGSSPSVPPPYSIEAGPELLSIDPLIYAVPANRCVPGMSLTPGQSCTVYVSLDCGNAAYGLHNGEVSLGGTYAGSQSATFLSASTAPSMVVEQGYLYEPYLALASNPVVITHEASDVWSGSLVRIYNYGGAPLQVSSALFPAQIYFAVATSSVVSDCLSGNSVAPGSFCTLQVVPANTTVDSGNDILSISSNAGNAASIQVNVVVNSIISANRSLSAIRIPLNDHTYEVNASGGSVCAPHGAPGAPGPVLVAEFDATRYLGPTDTAGFLEVGAFDVLRIGLNQPTIKQNTLSSFVTMTLSVYNSVSMPQPWKVTVNGFDATILSYPSGSDFVNPWGEFTVQVPIYAIRFPRRGNYPTATYIPENGDPALRSMLRGDGSETYTPCGLSQNIANQPFGFQMLPSDKNITGFFPAVWNAVTMNATPPSGVIGDSRPIANSSAPLPVSNVITIQAPTVSPPSGKTYCTAVGSGWAGFQAAAPVVFIHGNGADGTWPASAIGSNSGRTHIGFFDRRGFTSALPVPYDAHIDMSMSDPDDGTIQQQSCLLSSWIPQIAKSFGVDGVHLVAHSKGGLSARYWLTDPFGYAASGVKVYSLTTMSTPHEGSMLADLEYESELANVSPNDSLNSFDTSYALQGYSGSFLFDQAVGTAIGALTGNKTVKSADAELSTSAANGFNSWNIAQLPPEVTYNLIGSDADLNGNGEIDTDTDFGSDAEWDGFEDEGLIQEESGLNAVNSWNGAAGITTFLGLSNDELSDVLTAAHQLLRRVYSVGLEQEYTYDSHGTPSATSTLTQTTFESVDSNPTVTANALTVDYPDAKPNLYVDYAAHMNDLAVELTSATAAQENWAANRVAFWSYSGASHATIASARIGQIVYPRYILPVDYNSGNMSSLPIPTPPVLTNTGKGMNAQPPQTPCGDYTCPFMYVQTAMRSQYANHDVNFYIPLPD